VNFAATSAELPRQGVNNVIKIKMIAVQRDESHSLPIDSLGTYDQYTQQGLNFLPVNLWIDKNAEGYISWNSSGKFYGAGFLQAAAVDDTLENIDMWFTYEEYGD
jgi:hypothetical protein